MKHKLIFILGLFPNLLFSSIFIDVRSLEEFETESIENTHHIEWQNILDVKELASQGDEIYLFCRSGNRSEKARKILQDAGYRQVFNIGGLEEAKDFIRRKRNDL